MSNSFELYMADGRAAGIYGCSQCHHVHSTKEAAELCCTVRLCTCGAALPNYWRICTDCQNADLRQREAERFAAAVHLTTWDGPVFADGLGHMEGFFKNLDELFEYMDEQPAGESMPAYVWTCDVVPVLHMDLEWILENATEDAYEDFEYSDLTGIDELEKAIRRFEEVNKNVGKWVPNYIRAVVLKPEASNEPAKDTSA